MKYINNLDEVSGSPALKNDCSEVGTNYLKMQDKTTDRLIVSFLLIDIQILHALNIVVESLL